MNEPILQVNDLHYYYNDNQAALNGISVSIYPGERIAVIGSNGAGKSTFSEYQRRTFSRTWRNFLSRHKDHEEIPARAAEKYRHRVPGRGQSDHRFLRKSRDIFWSHESETPREEVSRRVNMAMEYMNITEYGDRPPHYLSGGEKSGWLSPTLSPWNRTSLSSTNLRRRLIR